MEEVLDKLESAAIGSMPNNTVTEYDHLYKNWGKLGNQEQRRKELLENQKNKRLNELDHSRGIIELVHAAEENDADDEFNQDSHRRAYYRPSIYVAGFHKVSNKYRKVLTMSEWIVERPDDLHDEWYVSPCPVGVRMLVVANKGATKCYTKYGKFKFKTRSALPGSNCGDNNNTLSKCCVLDCFYDENRNTMYVIDFLAWNNQPMTDCEAEFRNFWLQSQFAERPELGVISKNNQVRFVLLPKVPCTPDKLNEFMMIWPHFELTQLDGFLFYHKKAHYVSGRSPLVGWLYPYMVQEVLGADITMHPVCLALKPKDYVDQKTFIKQFDELGARKHVERNLNQNYRMDTSQVKPKTSQVKPKAESDVWGSFLTGSENVWDPYQAEEKLQEGSKKHSYRATRPKKALAMDSEEVPQRTADDDEKVETKQSNEEASLMEAEENPQGSTVDDEKLAMKSTENSPTKYAVKV